MKTLSVREISQAVQGKLLRGNAEATACVVSTDTRKEAQGSVFFALVGENFDAHAYLDKASEKGASVIVAQHVPNGMQTGESAVVIVEDTLLALQQFAAWYRKLLDVTVVGITGSNGKTSTKDFTKAVLGAQFSVNATKGNLNNHIGLPLTVLETEEEHQVGVWEMGMNHPGEIAPLCQIAQPQIGIITNIGTAHIEYMGSRDAIAEEKGALARSLTRQGTLIIPASCDYGEYFKKHTQARIMVVGNGRGVVRAEGLQMNAFGSEFNLIIEGDNAAKVSLPVVGKHMVTNAMLAAGAGRVMGMSGAKIAEALNNAELTSGRLRSFMSGGVRVIDDTYNANPESVRAAIDTLSDLQLETSGTRYVVLGKMAELGEHAQQAYLDLGSHAADLGLQVISVGAEAEEIYAGAHNNGGNAKHFNEIEDAAEWLKGACGDGDAVLFKGSRAAAMERVMNQAFETH